MHAPASFYLLRRAALITRIAISNRAEQGLHGSWEGQSAEAEAGTFLRKLRLGEPSWNLALRIHLTLEDGSETSIETDWEPTRLPNVRHIVAQRLAQLAETLPPIECVEAHRVLELLEGRSLPYLRDPKIPRHLREAIGTLQRTRYQINRPVACAACGLVVGHEFAWRIHRRNLACGCAHRHFREDGTLCTPTDADGSRSLRGRASDSHGSPPSPFSSTVMTLIRNVHQ